MPFLRKRAIIFILLSLSLILPLQARLSLGIFVGQSWQKPAFENLQFKTDTCWAYGLRAGLRILIFGLEAQYFQVAHNLNLSDPAHFWQNRQVDFSSLNLAIKTYFSLLIFHPYLSLGYGYYSLNLQELAEEKKASFNFGAGLELSLGEKFSLQVEGRYHWPSLSLNRADFRLGDLVVTAGLNYHF